MLKKYIDIQNRLAQFQQGDDEGAAMVEYGILVGGIAVVVIALVYLLGGEIADLFQSILDKL